MGKMNWEKVCNMEGCNLNELRNDVKEIKNALLGDDFNKNGLVQRVEKVEAKLSLHDKYFWLAIGGGSLLIFATQILSSCN